MQLAYHIFDKSLSPVTRMTVLTGDEMSLSRLVHTLQDAFTAHPCTIRGTVQYGTAVAAFECLGDDLAETFRESLRIVKA